MTTTGVEMVVNMPTEEIFTTPHRLRTEGVVRSTMPLVVNGQIVRDLSVRFSAGRVTEVTATNGADVVREEMSTDEGGSYLGEVSIVDGDSRRRQDRASSSSTRSSTRTRPATSPTASGSRS